MSGFNWDLKTLLPKAGVIGKYPLTLILNFQEDPYEETHYFFQLREDSITEPIEAYDLYWKLQKKLSFSDTDWEIIRKTIREKICEFMMKYRQKISTNTTIPRIPNK